MKLEELADHAFEKAKEISREGEQVNATFLFLASYPDPDKLVIIGLPQYAAHKDLAIASMKAALDYYQASHYAFVCEAWMAMPKTAEERAAAMRPGYAPSRDPKRISAIVVIAKSRAGEDAVRFCEIKKRGGKTAFKNLDTSGAGHMIGVLDNLFGELGKPS